MVEHKVYYTNSVPWTKSKIIDFIVFFFDRCGYAQFLDLLFPQAHVNLKKVKFNSKLEHEYIQNWKIVQSLFKKISIEKVRMEFVLFQD